MKIPRWLQWLVFGVAFYLYRLNRTRQPLIVAGHRGGAGLAPENTLASLRNGYELGARWLEVDVQRTRDGVAVGPPVQFTLDAADPNREMYVRYERPE